MGLLGVVVALCVACAVYVVGVVCLVGEAGVVGSIGVVGVVGVIAMDCVLSEVGVVVVEYVLIFGWCGWLDDVACSPALVLVDGRHTMGWGAWVWLFGCRGVEFVWDCVPVACCVSGIGPVLNVNCLLPWCGGALLPC